jgi:hypothetical protein
MQPVAVTHNCNPSYSRVINQEVEIQGLTEASPGKKSLRYPTILTNKLGVVVYIYNPSYTGGLGRRIKV